MKKNKKIWFLVTLFLGLLFCFTLVMAVEKGPNECCMLDHNLEEIDTACKKDTLVAATTSVKYWCDWDDDGENDIDEVTPAGLTKNWSKCCIVDSIYNLTDWIFYILLAGIAIFYIAGAIFFLQASGDPNKVKQAQSFIFYGSIGLLLALMSRIIPAILKAIVS